MSSASSVRHPEKALATMLQASSDVTFEGTVLYERAGSRQFLTVASTAEGKPGGVAPDERRGQPQVRILADTESLVEENL